MDLVERPARRIASLSDPFSLSKPELRPPALTLAINS
jgi:hypothetical protein